ncbi:MAG: hypothetical protein KAK00_01935 [Nanoarchaeota archaeon]|nr:hypothetical protein [Nanoarchaeota archaeon]
MKKICVLLVLIIFSLFLVQASGICGDGLCDLKIENYENCPNDCIKEENFDEKIMGESQKCYVGDKEVECPRDINDLDRRVLPKQLQQDMGSYVFIVPFLAAIIGFILLLIFRTKIAGKTLKEYLWPIRYYILGSILVVIMQYTITFENLFILRLTQALWALMVALSILLLVKKYDFRMKNVIITGVLYCFIIHGLKVSIRFFFYDRPVWYLIDRFIYGSILVMILALILGLSLTYLKKKGAKL